jgi:hypothetical protein
MVGIHSISKLAKMVDSSQYLINAKRSSYSPNTVRRYYIRYQSTSRWTRGRHRFSSAQWNRAMQTDPGRTVTNKNNQYVTTRDPDDKHPWTAILTGKHVNHEKRTTRGIMPKCSQVSPKIARIQPRCFVHLTDTNTRQKWMKQNNGQFVWN